MVATGGAQRARYMEHAIGPAGSSGEAEGRRARTPVHPRVAPRGRKLQALARLKSKCALLCGARGAIRGSEPLEKKFERAFPSSLVRRGWAVSAGRSPKTQPCRGRVSGQMGPILSLGGAPVASRRLLDEGRTPLRRRRLNFDPAAYLLRVASRLRPSHAPTRPPGPACPTHPSRRAPRARRRSRAEVGARRRRSTSAARGVSRGLFERSQERRRSPWPWGTCGPWPVPTACRCGPMDAVGSHTRPCLRPTRHALPPPAPTPRQN